MKWKMTNGLDNNPIYFWKCISKDAFFVYQHLGLLLTIWRIEWSKSTVKPFICVSKYPLELRINCEYLFIRFQNYFLDISTFYIYQTIIEISKWIYRNFRVNFQYCFTLNNSDLTEQMINIFKFISFVNNYIITFILKLIQIIK